MKKIDYHVHSSNSFDSKASIDDICIEALRQNMNEICFTDHFNEPIYEPLQIDTYVSEVKNAQEKYKDKLSIKLGLEIAEPFRNPIEIQEILKPYKWDFLLGSVHNVDNKKLRLYMENKDKNLIYEGYFKEIELMAKNSDVDVLAHLDLIKRYALDLCGNYDFTFYKDFLCHILSILISRNIGIEVNTSGLRTSLNEIFPKVEILRLYKDLGGKIITIGSDAHKSKDLAYGYKYCIELLKSLGFHSIYTFNKRIPKKIRI